MSGAGRKPARRARDWSWNRLDDDVARGLVTASGVGRRDLVLDIGAGDGSITAPLAATGASVVAFELHAERARTLRARFPTDRVKVVRADVRDLRLPRRPFRVVANPPFDGVSAVLARLTHAKSRLVRADVVLPRSTAAAWSKRLNGRTTWMLTVPSRIPRSAFTPRPRIDVVHAVIERA